MKTKDFFRLIIKIFGLYSLILALSMIFPHTVGYLINLSNINWFDLIGYVMLVIALGLLFFWLTFKPDVLIEKLKLEKGFDQDYIPFDKLNSSNILKIGCIVIGGFLVINNLAPFISGSSYLLQESVQNSIGGMFDANISLSSKVNVVTNLINLVLGYLLITNYDWISKLLLPKNEASD